jgi:hypothetical protein
MIIKLSKSLNFMAARFTVAFCVALCICQFALPFESSASALSPASTDSSVNPLSSSELQALSEYPNWVASNGSSCSSDSATSDATSDSSPASTDDSSATSDNSDSTCCPTDTGGTTGGTLTGTDNIQETFNYFVSAGFSAAAAAGIAGNFMQESGGGVTIDPTAGNQSAGGIAGFTTGSLSMSAMESWVNSHGEDPTSLKGQLDFVEYFITQETPSIAQDMKSVTSAEDAAVTWENDFEGCLGSRGTGNPNAPGSCMQNQRIQYANEVYGLYGGGGSGGSTTTTTTTGTATGTGTTADSCTGTTGTTGTVTANASVASAVAAAKELSNAKKPYPDPDVHYPLTQDVAGIPAYDCSESVSWVLLKAGFSLPDSATWGDSAPVSGDFTNWGAAGPGQEMTIWASADHVFIEFNVPGLGHYQLNTSYSDSVNGVPPDSGPQFFLWGQNGASDAASGGFVARHWPGT